LSAQQQLFFKPKGETEMTLRINSIAPDFTAMTTTVATAAATMAAAPAAAATDAPPAAANTTAVAVAAPVTLPPHGSYLSVDRKFLDLFMSIHAHFFLLNPRSSFSWQVRNTYMLSTAGLPAL
jgi:hypothetical protein